MGTRDETNIANPNSRRRRLIKRLGLLGTVSLMIWAYTYGSDRISFERLDGQFDPKYGYAAGRRESAFSQEFPSRSQIEAHLSEATLLISHPPNNAVYYFDNNHHFLRWTNETIEAGEWSIWPKLKILILNGQHRFAVEYVFCHRHSGLDPIAQQDNCYYLSSLDSIFAQGRGTRTEYRKGNVFKLAATTNAAGKLPNTELTIDSLLVKNTSHQ